MWQQTLNTRGILTFDHTLLSPTPADIRGLSNTSHLEQLNKRYWYVCQDFTEYKYPHQPKRFPEIMLCLPEIRYIAGKRDKCDAKADGASRWCRFQAFVCAVSRNILQM